MGIAGLVLGICSLVLASSWVLGGICAVLAIVFSALAQTKARTVGRNNGMAIAGLICGGVGLAIAALLCIVSIELMSQTYAGYPDVGIDYTQNM